METRNFMEDNIFRAENIRKCEEYIISIQRRLDKAVADNDQEGIRETFDLLAKRSQAVKIYAIWRITQVNKGKYTAGVDNIAVPKSDRKTQYQFRLNLLDRIDLEKPPNRIRRVYIPKPNGDKRPLGIPTLQDRINQEILRIALEPIVEYHFNTNSFGFRPKRSCQDAMSLLFRKLCKGNAPQYILEGDIKGCFDNIKHEHIIKTLTDWQTPKWAIEIISKMLKAKIFHKGRVYEDDNSETGTPQGGVISPLLANVALTTLDDFCYSKYGYRTVNGSTGMVYYTNPIVRYADDFVIVCKTKEKAEETKAEISKHLLTTTGLTLSEEKSKITHITEGFDFLGFNFRKYKPKGRLQVPPKTKTKSQGKSTNAKLLIKPSKEKVIQHLQECKKVLTDNKTAKQNSIILLLNPKMRGWAMYYRHVVSSKTFKYIYHEMWHKLFRWAKRRHPSKSNTWIMRKYFAGKIENIKSVFTCHETGTYIMPITTIKIKRFTLVDTHTRVYDKTPQVIEYWKEREYTNAYKQITSVKMRNLYKRQKGLCIFCKEQITDKKIRDLEVHIHHMKPRSFKGNEGYSNLRLLHNECHRELHAKFTRKEMAELWEKDIDYIQS